MRILISDADSFFLPLVTRVGASDGRPGVQKITQNVQKGYSTT